MSYRDKDWCCHSKSCANNKCYRNLDYNRYESDCKEAKFEYQLYMSDFKTKKCGFIQKTISEINTNDKKVSDEKD